MFKKGSPKASGASPKATAIPPNTYSAKIAGKASPKSSVPSSPYKKK